LIDTQKNRIKPNYGGPQLHQIKKQAAVLQWLFLLVLVYSLPSLPYYSKTGYLEKGSPFKKEGDFPLVMIYQ